MEGLECIAIFDLNLVVIGSWFRRKLYVIVDVLGFRSKKLFLQSKILLRVRPITDISSQLIVNDTFEITRWDNSTHGAFISVLE